MVLVTGANGQVGQELQAIQQTYPSLDIHFATRQDLDITGDLSDLKSKYPALKYIVNAAAYTAVDKAESDAVLAKAINTTAVKNMAQYAADHDIRLLHISSDYVYHTDSNKPYKETDKTEPKGIYAQTKLEGDLSALAENPKAIILRTSWIYSRFGNNFVKTMLRLGKERAALGVVFDQIGTPTNAADLAKAIYDIIIQVEAGNQATGIFHYSNEGVTSWYDFAEAIFEIKDINCIVSAIESKDYPLPAARPHFSVLNKSKIKEAFDLEIPHWRTSLLSCLSKL